MPEWTGRGAARDTIPPHYESGGLQPWDVVDAFNLDFYLGNVSKYILRAGKKGPALPDLRKAAHYLQYAIERAEEDEGDARLKELGARWRETDGTSPFQQARAAAQQIINEKGRRPDGT